MTLGLDVRRLAAIDMWGSAGVRWRRWVILAEFLLGVVVSGALGVVSVSSGGVLRTVVGCWLIGLAANYVPLSVHALTLIRPGALEAEIRGVDVPGELRHYTTAQLWVVVPLLLVVLAVGQWRRNSR
ncbi:hypothetical protein [Micromonospora endolithica]|uniref:Uncharacterized protein n=1 Tax=Micromonospora endolithica TaxID=230091 RepID=A0A3A9ZDD3_9ACTN|nr:hypothetical protein [Micromonospora endolithica]RKN45337.1 hypothetical protein D7223_17105 [Micromonospora endolithica]